MKKQLQYALLRCKCENGKYLKFKTQHLKFINKLYKLKNMYYHYEPNNKEKKKRQRLNMIFMLIGLLIIIYIVYFLTYNS